jgi:hypothetical protein
MYTVVPHVLASICCVDPGISWLLRRGRRNQGAAGSRRPRRSGGTKAPHDPRSGFDLVNAHAIAGSFFVSEVQPP